VKYLFVHQNFPGQFLHFVRHLVRQKCHDIVFISEPNQNVMAGVRKVPYRKPEPPSEATHWTVREVEAALRRAEVVAATARNLKGLGFEPDIVIGHHGWGELLNLRDVWPDVPMIGYFEFFYHTNGIDVGFDPEFPTHPADFPRIRAKNAVNLLALNLGAHGQTPTEWQLSTYPAWARSKIAMLPEGVDLDMCRPDPAVRKSVLQVGDWEIKPNEKLVTYVSRDLEPYRGCHVLMRALPRLLAKRRDVRVIMVGGDGVSYGMPPGGTTWKQTFLTELGDRLDHSRVLFPGKIPYETYIKMLQRSDAHVYLTYPFVASWSLREAIAIGGPVIGSDTPPVREFITDGQNGLLTSFFDPAALADTILNVLEDRPLAQRLRAGARQWADKHLAMRDYLARYDALVGSVASGGPPEGQGVSPPPIVRPFDETPERLTSVIHGRGRTPIRHEPNRSPRATRAGRSG
jgi:glycosyltransferase involved in cell wall biosynthesis